jgi:hypothetical protein
MERGQFRKLMHESNTSEYSVVALDRRTAPNPLRHGYHKNNMYMS